MRMSRLFFRTLREAPAEAETANHRLLVRGGFIQPVATGIFDFLPLGVRVKHKIERIIREELEALGAQEVNLPVVQPAELWQRSGRWHEVGSEMARLKDRSDRDLCLGMTHEEVVTDLVAHIVRSYRQLPVVLYQIQTKFRDEPRARGGLIRVREFTMKDAYSFHASETDLDAYYPQVFNAYERIFARCGLEVIAVESDTGMMGGAGAHEFMALTPVGEDTLLLCNNCNYRANRQIATFRKRISPEEELLPVEEIATPDTSTIDALSTYLGVPAIRTAKAVFLAAEREHLSPLLIFAVLRGDMDLNETKLANVIGMQNLRSATPEEIRAVGAEPGYASPIGIGREGVLVVVDDVVTQSFNLVAGANRKGYHLKNTSYGRDYEADIIADIAAASDGDLCPTCSRPMSARRGVEVGNIFKLATRYSGAMGATFLDEQGNRRPLVMGCYGIGTGRLMACVIEHYHDEAGICWPANVAPYHLSLIPLDGKRTPAVSQAADDLYQHLLRDGIEVLYDDRDERPGVKFADADLIGLPLRITLGKRGLEHGLVELKVRRTGETREVRSEHALAAVREVLAVELQPPL